MAPTTTPAECIGTCFHRTWNEFGHSNLAMVVQAVRDFCECKDMERFCSRAGLVEPSFEWSHHMRPRRGLVPVLRNQLYNRFWEACRTNPDRPVAVVFHGTSEDNVDRVLKHGLDPRLRRTQAFGKGEYFAKEPGLSTTYCHGGHKIVVYLVLLPEDQDAKWSQRDRDIVVVDNIDHQLPIGVLSYTGVRRKVVQCTQRIRLQQQKFKNDAMEKERKAKRAAEMTEDERLRLRMESPEELQEQAQRDWQAYYRMREDEQRNEHYASMVAEQSYLSQ